MKTILVLTDFSKAAGSVTEFALELAQKSSASLLLYHSFIEPECDPTAAPVLWRIEEYHTAKEQSDSNLKEQVYRLIKKLRIRNDLAFQPEIRCMNEYGTLHTNVQKFLTNPAIRAVVMGSKNDVDKVQHPDAMLNKILLHAKRPVFVVPAANDPVNSRRIIYAANPEYHDDEMNMLLNQFVSPDKYNLLLSDTTELIG